MSVTRQFLDVLDNADAPPLTQRDESGELLLTMLVHMFFADGVFADEELNVLRRLVGEMNDAELRQYCSELSARPLDFDQIRASFPSHQERDYIVTLAEHGIWGDNVVEPGEVDMIEKLMAEMGIEAG